MSDVKEPVLKNAKVYEYRPPKFFNDYLVSGFNNNVLVTRFQPYQGGKGPIQLSNGDPFNGIIGWALLTFLKTGNLQVVSGSVPTLITMNM